MQEGKIVLFFYIRHGDPIYNPDSLTPLGKRQAEALAKRLSIYGIDKFYASTSARARLTAQPTAEYLQKDVELLDFANEAHAWQELGVETPEGRRWCFQVPEIKEIFHLPEVRALGDKWYEYPALEGYKLREGVERIRRESDAFFESLGYKHEGAGRYKVIRQNDDRVALFAHQGFGISFLGAILGIPFPQFTTHFDICCTGLTVIEFLGEDGYCYPRILTLANDSHLFREGLPLDYCHRVKF